MTDTDIERRRAADARRQQAAYRRRAMGLSVYRMDLPDDIIVDLVVEAGLLDIADCANHSRVQAALAKFLTSRPKKTSRRE